MNQKERASIRVAFAHYWYVTWRGGEKVTRAILDVFPNADIYTLFYDQSVCGPYLSGFKIHSSMLDRPFLRKRYQQMFPFYPMGVRSLILQGHYDLIISSESGPIKGISNPEGIPHLCYVHTPMRYCWGFANDYLNSLPAMARPLAKMAFESLRRYDETTVTDVTKYVANSRNVQARVRKYYNRDASVVYPPIALNLFDDQNLVTSRPSTREYYLSFGAITPYKRVGLLVDSFNNNGRRLVVIGEGSERKKLEARANSNIVFTGSLPYARICEYILGAKALLFPGEEDFGMIPLEVMAHGVPVLAYGAGGALETVVEANDRSCGTGIFFQQQTVDSLQAVIDAFEKVQDEFDPVHIREHARQFGEDHFKERITAEVRDMLNNPKQRL